MDAIIEALEAYMKYWDMILGSRLHHFASSGG